MTHSQMKTRRRTLGKNAAATTITFLQFMMIIMPLSEFLSCTSKPESQTFAYAYAPQPVSLSWRSNCYRSRASSTVPLFGVRSSLKRKWVSGRSKILKHFGTQLPSSTVSSSAPVSAAPPAPLSSGAEPYAKFKVTTTSSMSASAHQHGGTNYSNTQSVGLLERPSTQPLSLTMQQQQQEVTFVERASRHLVLDETSSANIQRAKSAAAFSDTDQGESATAASKVVERHERHMSKLAQEFYSMVHDFAAYTEADILSIADPRKRAVVDGVSSALRRPSAAVGRTRQGGGRWRPARLVRQCAWWPGRAP